MSSIAKQIVGVKEEDEDDPIKKALQDCDSGQQHLKLKQSKVTSAQKEDNDFFNYQTLMEVVLIADTKVTQSKR